MLVARQRKVAILLVVGAVLILAACGSSHATPIRKRHPAHEVHGKSLTFGLPVPRSGACGMEAGTPGLPTTVVECLVFPAPRLPAHKVGRTYLYASGRVNVCRGERCLANPEPRWTLHLDESVAVGPFRCTALRSGTLCVVKKTGQGFLLDERGLTERIR